MLYGETPFKIEISLGLGIICVCETGPNIPIYMVAYVSVSQPFLSCVPPEPICHTMSTPMLMILKKYNVTQVIIKCFHVPPAVCLRTPRGTRTPGWESLAYVIPTMFPSILLALRFLRWFTFWH